jgi:hypothetical protein
VIRRISRSKREDASSAESDVFDSCLLRKAQVTKAALFRPEMRGFGLQKEQDASLAYQPSPDLGLALAQKSERLARLAWGTDLHRLEYESKEYIHTVRRILASCSIKPNDKALYSVERHDVQGCP